MQKKRFLVVSGIVISLFFLWLSFKDFKINEIWDVLKNLQPLWLIGGIFLFLFSHFLRGIRWKLILAPSYQLSFKNSLGALFISLLGNNIFPWKLGDIWRILLVKKKGNISRLAAGSSLFLERIYDGLSILLIIWFSILFFHTSVPPLINKTIFYFGIFILASIILMIFFYHFFTEKIKSLEDNSLWKKLFSGISLLENPKASLALVTFSLIIWIIETLSYGAFIKAFSFHISFSLLALLIFVVNVALLIPAAPGYIGTFEYAMILAFSAFGVSKNSGLTIALVIHFLRYISTSTVGLYFLSTWHLKLPPPKQLSLNKNQQ